MKHPGPRAAGFSIRPATGADIEGIAAIERTVFADPWSRRSFADLLASSLVVFLVAADETDTVAGYAVVLAASPESELANLAVAQEVQRSGVGRMLLSAVQREARNRGCREMFLEVRASNAGAGALYASSGFRTVGRRPRYYTRPVEDAIVMRAELDLSGVGSGRSRAGDGSAGSGAPQ